MNVDYNEETPYFEGGEATSEVKRQLVDTDVDDGVANLTV